MTFAGLKRKADEAEVIAARERERKLLTKVAADNKFAEEAVACAESAAQADPIKRRVKVLQLEEAFDCPAPVIQSSPSGFGLTWDPIQPAQLRGRARATWELLVRTREELPEEERFDIELVAHPLGYDAARGWDMGIYIKW